MLHDLQLPPFSYLLPHTGPVLQHWPLHKGNDRTNDIQCLMKKCKMKKEKEAKPALISFGQSDYKQITISKQLQRSNLTKPVIKKINIVCKEFRCIGVSFPFFCCFPNRCITFCNSTNSNCRLHISPHCLYLRSQVYPHTAEASGEFFTGIQVYESWGSYHFQ